MQRIDFLAYIGRVVAHGLALDVDGLVIAVRQQGIHEDAIEELRTIVEATERIDQRLERALEWAKTQESSEQPLDDIPKRASIQEPSEPSEQRLRSALGWAKTQVLSTPASVGSGILTTIILQHFKVG
jgi:hypothetical protein